MRTTGLLAVVAPVLLWGASRISRVEVSGASMAPTLLPGDRLLVVPVRRLRPGDLVVLPDPRAPRRPLVKRVSAIPGGRCVAGDLTLQAGPDEIVVLGDNPNASTDSRTTGPVRLDAVEGRAVYRYHPADRVGRVG